MPPVRVSAAGLSEAHVTYSEIRHHFRPLILITRCRVKGRPTPMALIDSPAELESI